jgi:hypothetical protein
VFVDETNIRYTGGFFNDLREGMGVMENATVGWKFGGDWSKGRRHGNGELTVSSFFPPFSPPSFYLFVCCNLFGFPTDWKLQVHWRMAE